LRMVSWRIKVELPGPREPIRLCHPSAQRRSGVLRRDFVQAVRCPDEPKSS
jgi:hypothetical protein